MDGFVHLHLHSEYSLLDGACRISDIPDAALSLGMTAVAITDHGVMSGCPAFYDQCKKKGIKAIIGCEVYLTGDRMSHERDYSHLVLLVKNEEGYRNLISLVSRSYTEGFYCKPRVDKELLRRYSGGLYCLSGCIYGEIPKDILSGDFVSARKHSLEMKEIFGENFYFELQDHGTEEEMRVISALAELSAELSIPLVATNDVHYLKRSDSAIQKVLSSIGNQSGEGGKDPFDRPEFWLKPYEDMAKLFADHPEAIENTVKIAENCNFDFVYGKMLLPEFACPEGQSADNYLRTLANEGLESLAGNGGLAEGHSFDDYKMRMIYELMIISKMGYSGYYLIVRDFIFEARRRNIPVGPGRGSGAGSLVAYLVGITRIDPILHGLLFERFLNPERVSMPDFDTDFADDRREEIIAYVAEKYGRDRVCQIAAFGTLAARAAIRDCGRALSLPYDTVDKAARLVPRDPKITIEAALRKSSGLKELYDSDDDVRKLLTIARSIEGMPRNTTIHAAGVVISQNPLDSVVPLFRSGDTVMTQYDMNTVADLGLLKFDFLAIRYLSVIANTEKLILEKEKDFSVENIPLNDKETFEMLSRGSSAGLFQLESPGMKKLLIQMKPESIDDIMVAISLYRPGPMDSIPRYLECRNDKSRIHYELPELEDILGETYGCIVYQEQVMQICRRLASYSYGRADTVRKLMAKKKPEEMENERSSFLSGCSRNAIDLRTAEKIFDRMAKFAEYAFCKSHAAAYSYTSYRTAYLKCHYTAEYYASLLSSVIGNPQKTAEYISDCADFGIKCYGPSIMKSGVSFTADESEIYFGLSGIKNIGLQFAENLVLDRKTKGGFRDIYDFVMRMSSIGINKTQLYSLICSGALDCFGVSRATLLCSYEEMLLKIAEKNRRELDGQVGFSFDADGDGGMLNPKLNEMPELDDMTRLSFEKEMTGMYFSGHPIDGYSDFIIKNGYLTPSAFQPSVSDEENPDLHDSDRCRIAGIIVKVSQKKTSSGDTMAFVTVEDRFSECEIVFFKNQYAKFGSLLYVGAPIAVSGNVSLRDDGSSSVICFEALPMRKTSESGQIMTRSPEHGAETPKIKEKRLYVKVRSLRSTEYKRILALSEIFSGDVQLVIYDGENKNYIPSGRVCAGKQFVLDRFTHIAGGENVIFK